MPERTAQADRRKELGRFLRTMRERVEPSRHGISTGTRRRAPGLLREEVALFAGIDPEDPAKRNLLKRLFLDAAWRTLFADWEVVARSAIAQFRAATVGYASASDIRAVLDPLRALSPEFERQWAEMRVEGAP